MATATATPLPLDAPGRAQWQHGWIWLTVVTLSRAYLVFFLTLAAIAIVPGLTSWNSYVVQTGSMAPRIKPGDVVVTSPLARTAALPLGRVVSFTSNSRQDANGEPEIIVHRIVELSPQGRYLTAGDANPNLDSDPLTRDQITGQGRLLVRYIGLPFVWLHTHNWTPLLIWTFITLLALAITAANPLGRLFDVGPPHDADPPQPSTEPIASAETAEGSNASPGWLGFRAVSDRRWAIVLAIVCALAITLGGTYGLHLASGKFSARSANARNTWAFQTTKTMTSADYTVVPANGSAVWTGNTVKVSNVVSLLSNSYPLSNLQFTATGNIANTGDNSQGWGVWVRASVTNNLISGYCFTIDAIQQKFYVRWWSGGREMTSPSLATVKFPNNFNPVSPHAVMLKITGNTLQAYVDAVLYATGTLPTQPSTVGGFTYQVPTGTQYGVRTWSQTVATISTMTVTAL
jgi:signal peptidase I